MIREPAQESGHVCCNHSTHREVLPYVAHISLVCAPKVRLTKELQDLILVLLVLFFLCSWPLFCAPILHFWDMIIYLVSLYHGGI